MPSTSSALDSLERVTFEKGKLLFNEGDESYYFYIVQDGEVDIFLPATKTEPEIHLNTAAPGDPVGEFALIVKKPRSASARTKTKCTLIKVSESGYQSLLKDLPVWAINVLENLVNRLCLADERLRKSKVENAAATLKQIEKILNSAHTD